MESAYQKAVSLYGQKQYPEAYAAFYEIMGYKDSESLMYAILEEVAALTGAYADRGDYGAAYDLLKSMGYSDSELSPNYVPEMRAYNYAKWGDYKGAVACGLTKIILPEGTTEIAERAFEGCTGLVELVMPDSVKKIGANAFSGCTSLAKLTLSGALESIGMSALANCKALDKLVLPKSLVSIQIYGLNSFGGEIYYEGTMTEWENVRKESMGSTMKKTIHCLDGDVLP